MGDACKGGGVQPPIKAEPSVSPAAQGEHEWCCANATMGVGVA